MTPSFLLDTGPLVALLNRRDPNHEWAKSLVAGRRPPALTCEAVLSEACFLLRAFPGGADAVMGLVEKGLLHASFRIADEAAVLRRLMARYANVPMSLADACLVRMSELHPQTPIATFDEDFTIYRRSGRRVVPTLMPEKR
jgi:uncharacterized protein